MHKTVKVTIVPITTCKSWTRIAVNFHALFSPIDCLDDVSIVLMAESLIQSKSTGDDRLIEWCFTPLSTVFQLYYGDSSHYARLSWVSPVLGLGFEMSCARTILRKTKGIQCCSYPGLLDYAWNICIRRWIAFTNVNKNLTSALGTVENCGGTGANAGYQHFLLSSLVYIFKRFLPQASFRVRMCGK